MRSTRWTATRDSSSVSTEPVEPAPQRWCRPACLGRTPGQPATRSPPGYGFTMNVWVRRFAWMGGVCAWTAVASSAPNRSITRMDIELLSDILAPRASAFAPGVVAWVEPGGDWYQIVLLEAGDTGRRQVIDFSMPVMLGGGSGIAWLGHREPSLPPELCVAVPEIRCAAAPRSASNTVSLQVGMLEGDPIVWFAESLNVRAMFRLDDARWQPIPLPEAMYQGVSSVLPAGDGFLLSDRDGLTRWSHQDGAWTSEPLSISARGHSTLSDSHLIFYEEGPLPRPSRELLLHDHRPPAPGQLHRVRRDGGVFSTVQGDVGHLSLLLPHGEEGTVIVGSHQAEYWQGDALMWQLPSSDMSGASWEGHPWVSIGSTRMRLDSAAIEVTDPVPGRFVWSERITPELVTCGDGHGLAWRHGGVSWHAWMADDHVQIGHACPEGVDPWPPGVLTECAEGTRLEVDDHVACVAVSTRQYATRTSMVQLTRRVP